MSSSHRHALFIHANSVLHRLAPQIKIMAAFLILIGIVVTPRRSIWAFVIYLLLLVLLTRLAHLPPRKLFPRLVVLIPFLLLSLLLPWVGGEPKTNLGSLQLSEPGLWDMWNLWSKSVLGLWIAVLLGATTEVTDLIRGLGWWRVPSVITTILAFMFRYLDVMAAQLTRMKNALVSRGHQPRWGRGWQPYTHALGTLFVRSYERGERVYLGMVSRGFVGHIPSAKVVSASRSSWYIALGMVVSVWLIAIAAWTVTG